MRGLSWVARFLTANLRVTWGDARAIQNVTDFAGQEREAGTSQITRGMSFARERRVMDFAIAASAAPLLSEAPPPPCG